MKYIILCGGRGERFISSYPKPLNRVCGKMVGQWMMGSLMKYDIKEIIWILNPKLYKYNIEEEIINWGNGNIKNIFVKLPYETRDPSETLELALQNLDFEESFICLDNDNIYVDGLEKFGYEIENGTESAVLVSLMDTGACSGWAEGSNIKYPPRYGFVKLHNNIIIDGKEKEIGWGENAYSIGGYWFLSCDICKQWLSLQRKKDGFVKEKSLLNLIISYSKKTQGIISKETFSIGTPQDCDIAEKNKKKYFGWNGVKIVVDLDNTLVTYPREYKNYSTVTPKEKNVNWIRDKSEKGADIIISTARKMKTHNGNSGKVMSDIGLLTLQTIKDLNINESEIHLGKPRGDIYIDDSGINPYDLNWNLSAGDWSNVKNRNPMNSLPVTRNVSISLIQVEQVVKKGSLSELLGQSNYYNFLNNTNEGRSVRHFFPRCYDNYISPEGDTTITLILEYIKGVPASFIWCHGLWGFHEWNLCVSSLKQLHSLPLTYSSPPSDLPVLERAGVINHDDIINGYLTKVDHRRLSNSIYNELDPDCSLLNLLKQKLSSYKPTQITNIHGDSFMGNILFPMTGGIKFIDMRGEVNNKITTHGDPNYDWGKLAMSLLGMDSIVYNLPIRPISEALHWINYLDNPDLIISISLVLMYSTLCFYNKNIASSLFSRIHQIISYITP